MNKDIERIYEESSENQPQASEEVRTGYSNLNDAIEEYIEAVQKDAFAYGYQVGQKELGKVQGYRQHVNNLLDKLSSEQMRRIYYLLVGATTGGGVNE